MQRARGQIQDHQASALEIGFQEIPAADRDLVFEIVVSDVRPGFLYHAHLDVDPNAGGAIPLGRHDQHSAIATAEIEDHVTGCDFAEFELGSDQGWGRGNIRIEDSRDSAQAFPSAHGDVFDFATGTRIGLYTRVFGFELTSLLTRSPLPSRLVWLAA